MSAFTIPFAITGHLVRSQMLLVGQAGVMAGQAGPCLVVALDKTK